MKGQVSWVNELAVKEGKLETFNQLMEEMVSGASNEPGTLAYEWYISHDGGTVHVVKTYADSERSWPITSARASPCRTGRGGSWTVST
jgi:quinol monooxygenase YgiN